MSQDTIEPEIVNETKEIKEENNNSQKESFSKKVWAWILMALAVVYGILPIDAVPDIPLVGWVDDVMVGTAAFANLIQQQFFQTNDVLNKLFNIAKWILIGIAVLILLIAILIVTLIVK